MKKNGRRALAMLLTLAMLLSVSLTAWADEADVAGSDGGLEITPEYAAEVHGMRGEGLIDGEALTAMVDAFADAHNVARSNLSIGYVYTATGDAWYYNGDAWYYAASLYKLPLMMLLAEQVSAGELDQEDEIYGMTVSKIEEYVVTYSNNDWAHRIRTYLGGDEVWRRDAMGFSSLPEGSYDPDYMDYSYFSARYITEVLQTLYNNPDRFPYILDCMLKSEQAHYFRLSDSMHQYPIAQKYGAWPETPGHNFNHTAGIIYTENPFILTVMTDNAPSYERLIGDAAVMMTEYTLTLDAQLDAYRAQLAAQAEAERLAAEQAERERLAAEQAERERQAAAEAQAEHEQIAAEQRSTRSAALVVGIAGVGLALVVIGMSVAAEKRRKRLRYERFRARFEQELRAEGGFGQDDPEDDA